MPVPRFRPALAGLAMAACCTGAAAAPAHAAIWPLTPPVVDVSSPSVEAEDAAVATAPDGEAVVVWRREGLHDRIQASIKAAGGAYSAPVNLSADGGSAYDPQVAISATGEAVAVWKRFSGLHWIIQAAIRPAGGSFGTPVNLSTAGLSAKTPRVAVAASGEAVVVWERSGAIQYAIRPAGGSFGSPLNLANSSSDEPDVGIADSGAAIAAWERSGAIQASSRPAGGSFGAAATFASSLADDPSVAVAPNGAAVVAWERTVGLSRVIQANGRATATGTFGTAATISSTNRIGDEPDAAVASNGAAVVVWDSSSLGQHIAQAASRTTATGAFGAPVSLSGSYTDETDPVVGIASDGSAGVVWRRDPIGKDRVEATTRIGAGAFGAPVDISGPRDEIEDVDGSIAPTGAVTVAWSSEDDHEEIVQSLGSKIEPEGPYGDPSCANGKDDDADGLTDASDPVCQIAPPCDVTLTDGNDTYTDPAGRSNVICGLGGNDSISGTDGDDVIIGGPGNDTLLAGPGTNNVVGGDGDDVLGADGTGDDAYLGGDGRDRITYAARTAPVRVDLSLVSGTQGGLSYSAGNGQTGENDYVYDDVEDVRGGAGDDVLTGDDGPNLLDGQAGGDILTSLGGNDVLRGFDGDDTLIADGGDDTLQGGAGDDVVDAGSGDDTIVAENTPDGADRITAGSGVDLLNYGGRLSPTRVNLADPAPINGLYDPSTGASLEQDAISTDAENVVTDGADDLLVGNAADNVLVGNGGSDRLIGGDGSDTLRGGGGDDTLDGVNAPTPADANAVESPEAADQLFGDAGTDSGRLSPSDTGASIETLLGPGPAPLFP